MRLQAVVLGVALAGAVSPALAQERHVGLKVGVNVASNVFEGQTAGEYDGRRLGMIAGGFAVLPVGGPLAVQIEALYSQKGSKLSLEGTEIEAALELNYLDFPLLARFQVPGSGTTRFHAFVGPSLGYRISARSKLTDYTFDFAEGSSENIEDDVKRFDLGLVAGAGADIGRRFVVDARYSWGLGSLSKDDPDENFTIKNRVLSVMAGVRF